jgi:two-component system response regulator AtoC
VSEDSIGKGSILVVEDNLLVSMSLKEILQEAGYLVAFAESGKQAKELLEESSFSLALLNMILPDADGRKLLVEWREAYPEMDIIIFTAHGDISSAVECLKAGAYDFLKKPVERIELLATIENALKHHNLSKKVSMLTELTRRETEPTILGEVIGASKPMQDTVAMAQAVAQSDFSCLLITGESGTGKGLFAKTIHQIGQRKNKPFVEVNCSALPATLIESELFGHKRGAFTDAKEDKIGLFQLADSGTLFLDEIGDMDLALQAKLLKVMEEQVFRRIGDTRDIKVDVCIIAATNQKLEKQVKSGQFRTDLYYRLNVIPLKLTPLRERMGDVPQLVKHFLGSFSRKFGKKLTGFTDDGMEALTSYSWPGNVRELRNTIERGSILSPNPQIDAIHLMVPDVGRATVAGVPMVSLDALPPMPLAKAEKLVIEAAMREVGGNKNAAAKILGIHRTTLYKKLDELEIQV